MLVYMKPKISLHEASALIVYEPLTGLFRWLVPRSVVKVGDIAGATLSNGYVQISLKGRLYLAHRLAWLFTHQVWPNHHIDHINGVRNDNRIANLRDVSRSENNCNLTKVRRDNALGITGVRKSGDKFWARIKLHGKEEFLGAFESAAEAQAAYLKAKADRDKKLGLIPS